MLEIVKDVDLTGHSLSSNDLVHLGHKAGAVNLAKMVDLQLDLNALIFEHFTSTLCRCSQACTSCSSGADATSCCGSTDHAGLIKAFTILTRVLRRLQRDLDLDDLQIVLLIIRCMRANQQSLHGPIAIEGPIITEINSKNEPGSYEVVVKSTYVLRSGIHSTVRLGQVSACEYSVS